MMECPRCKEITLVLVDEEATDDPDRWVNTYECDSCGHLECHVSGLPSWYDEDDGQPDEAQEWHDFDPDC